MRVLITNDDGFNAPGIAALRAALTDLGQVDVVAPEVEQSGKSHAITYLEPLFVHEVKTPGNHGWVVRGTPADCVKVAVTQLCDPPPDLIVSGINHGLNAGINVLYSGTVAAALEGSFFKIPSVAISLEADPNPNWNRAIEIARQLIDQLLIEDRTREASVFNINIPTAATVETRGVKLVPMGHQAYGAHFIRRLDPKGRAYYWATGEPAPEPTDYYSDLSALAEGYIAVTPLRFDLSHYPVIEAGQEWDLKVLP